MDSSYRQIIKRILKEATMSKDKLTRLLDWYDDWNDKLNQYIMNQEHSKIVDTHFKVGVGLYSALKSVIKIDSTSADLLTDKMNTLRNKLVVINKAIKSIDSLK